MSEDYTTERFECDVKLDDIRQNFLNPIKNEKLCSYCRCHDHNWTCPHSMKTRQISGIIMKMLN